MNKTYQFECSVTHHIFMKEYCFIKQKILNIISIASAATAAQNALPENIFISVYHQMK